MKIDIYSTDFEKYLNIKFRKYPLSGSRVPCDGRTDRAKLTDTFRNFENAPKNLHISYVTEVTCNYFPGGVMKTEFGGV